MDTPLHPPGYFPHEVAAAERLLAREQDAARQAAADRRRAAQRAADAEDARDRLEAQTFDPARDDGMVDLYDGDHAAVIAEVPDGVRRDGWTVERRLLFLDRLAEHGSIVSACRAVGVTRQSVYKLRPRAPAFAAAMDDALRCSVALLADTLFDRALHGHQVPVVYAGEVVATRTVHHNALGLYLLRVRDPLNYAPIDELERWKKHRALPADPAPAAAPTDLIGEQRCLPRGDGGFDPAQFDKAPPAEPDPRTVSTSTTSPQTGTSEAAAPTVSTSTTSPPTSQRRQDGEPGRSPTAARAAQPSLGALQRAGTEGGDRLGPGHRPRRSAVPAVEPDARLEPHEVPDDSNMLGRHESSP